MRGDDERRVRDPGCRGARRPGREDEVGVDDVGPELPGGRDGPRGQRAVLRGVPPALVDHDAPEVVPEQLELIGELLHEDAQVGSRRAGIHLRDEKYAH